MSTKEGKRFRKWMNDNACDTCKSEEAKGDAFFSICKDCMNGNWSDFLEKNSDKVT